MDEKGPDILGAAGPLGRNPGKANKIYGWIRGGGEVGRSQSGVRGIMPRGFDWLARD